MDVRKTLSFAVVIAWLTAGQAAAESLASVSADTDVAAPAAGPLPDTDAQAGVPQAGPESPAAHAAAADEVVDIYAPKPGRRTDRFGLRRYPGDGDVILTPSARTLDEGDIQIGLDEGLLWRAQVGVVDEFTIEANSVWGFTAGLSGKYALVRRHNTALTLQLGAGAATVEKSMNWSHAALLYAKDYRYGAVHLGGYFVFVHVPRGMGYLVPQATAGAEVRLLRGVSAVGEFGYGNDILHEHGPGVNSGFVNAGVRFDFSQIYLTGALVVPTTDAFLDSAALAIPFVRIGGRF